jgi:MFS family permease
LPNNLPYLPVILGLQFLGGMAGVAFFVTMDSLLQSSTPSHFLGRVFGAFQTTNALLLLTGQGLAALLADHVNTVFLLNCAGGFYFLSGVVALLLLPKPATMPASQVLENMAE